MNVRSTRLMLERSLKVALGTLLIGMSRTLLVLHESFSDQQGKDQKVRSLLVILAFTSVYWISSYYFFGWLARLLLSGPVNPRPRFVIFFGSWVVHCTYYLRKHLQQ